MDKTPYDNIIHLPHHVSTAHPRMSLRDRAAQFSPFAALVGYFLFSESMSPLNIAGMALVFLSIFMLNAGTIRFLARRKSVGR